MDKITEKEIVSRGYVTYEDFGAVGDGVTEDFVAIYKAHVFANEHRLPVKGTPGKTYYIFETTMGTEKPFIVPIRTSVDWQGATFIIDDTKMSVWEENPYSEQAYKNIFNVLPDREHEKFRIDSVEALAPVNASGINKKTKKINLGLDWDGPVMIVPYSKAHKIFRRRGYGQYDGDDMHELIVVEADGTVNPDTPIMFDYKSIDYMDVIKLDPESAITLENGIFITKESKVNQSYLKEDGTYGYRGGYIRRGMCVTRSYTTVKNIEHRIEGYTTLLERALEHKEGSAYAGFFRSEYANELTYKDCIMPGRFAYTSYSSYNFGSNCVNKIVLDGCFQPNFWFEVDPETYELRDGAVYDKNCIGNARKTSQNVITGMGAIEVKGVRIPLCWGIGGTNYCKNMQYLNSTLTRFDAHAGLYNGKIINCNVSGMELTGTGEFVIEDSAWYPYSLNTPMLYLRGDYGFHWDGNIKIKNTEAHMLPDMNLNLSHFNYVNWYFGYTCVFPNITIDNLRYYDAKTGEPLAPGYKTNFFAYRENAMKMHLYDSGEASIFAVTDDDKDGYIDEPLFDINKDGVIDEKDLVDLDGDGRVGNTSLKYDDYFNKPDYKRGIPHPTCTVNLNAVCPPAYFKVVNNKTEDGKTVCNYVLKDTSGEGISDGGWHRDENAPDTMGGFFGATKFIYGEGEDDFFVGPANGKDESFVFTKEFSI